VLVDSLVLRNPLLRQALIGASLRRGKESSATYKKRKLSKRTSTQPRKNAKPQTCAKVGSRVSLCSGDLLEI